MPPPKIKEWIEKNYKPTEPEVDMTKVPLTFTAEEANSTVKIAKISSAPIVYLETSPTGEEGSWTEYIVGSTPTITLANVGDKVYFRAKQTNFQFGKDRSNYNRFVLNGKIAASGNLNTLLKADGSVIDLTDRSHCYYNMFQNCTALTQAPLLPATKLAWGCYSGMFQGCRNLNSINVNLLDWNTTNTMSGTENWVKNVSSSGTFTCPERLLEEFGTSRIPTGWTVVRKQL